MQIVNKACKIIYSAAFFAVCALPLVLKPFTGEAQEIGKKALAEKPSLRAEDGSLNSDFSTEAERYVSDRLPLRAELLSAAGFVKGDLLHGTVSNVICGKKGWLFFRDEAADYMNTNAMTDAEVQSLAVTLSLIEERVRENGSSFTFVAMPNKSTIYSEYMPACYKKSDENNLTRVQAALDAAGVTYTDMRQVMLDAKDSGVYHKRDTHWNYLGALFGYNAIMESLGKPHETYNGVSFSQNKNWRGDLDKLLYPAGGFYDWQYKIDIAWQPFRITQPRGITDPQAGLADLMSDKEEKDMRIAAENTGAAQNEYLYMVRDSFGRALLPFFIDNYKHTTFVRTDNPDVSQMLFSDTVYEIVERNLKNVIATAPYMLAPEREENAVSAAKAGGSCAAVYKDEGYAERIFGTLPADADMGDGRVYLRLENADGAHVYEAFPVVEHAELPDAGDKGFSMWFDSRSGLAGAYRLTVISGGTAYDAGTVNIVYEMGELE